MFLVLRCAKRSVSNLFTKTFLHENVFLSLYAAIFCINLHFAVSLDRLVMFLVSGNTQSSYHFTDRLSKSVGEKIQCSVWLSTSD